MPLHQKILISILVGLVLGLVAHELAPDAPAVTAIVDNVTYPVGEIWLRLLKMLAVPLIFSALVVGVAELDPRKLGRVGGKTLLYTVLTSVIAVGIGLLLVNLVQPGANDSEVVREMARALAEQRPVVKAPSSSGVEMIVNMVPSNPIDAAAKGDMIGLLLFGLMVGVAVTTLRTPAVDRFREMIQGLYEVSMKLIMWVIAMAPIGVSALVFTTMSRLGVEILPYIGLYVAVVVGALGLHMFGVYPLLLKYVAKRSPLEFFRGSRTAMATAFATASSNATLPTSLMVAENDLKLPRGISRFVLTAGSTMNQHGTALFEGVTVIFLAQLFDVPLDLGQQAMIMFVCVLGGVGTAGIPSGSLPVVAMILAMFNIPPEGLALVMGVDRFLDMCRTTLNVTGDLALAAVVSAGEEDIPHDPEPEPVTPNPSA